MRREYSRTVHVITFCRQEELGHNIRELSHNIKELGHNIRELGHNDDINIVETFNENSV